MPQHSTVVPDSNGINFLNNLNKALATLKSFHSGVDEPTETTPAMLWFDTFTGVIKQRNVANDGWLVKWDITKGELATLNDPVFTGSVGLPIWDTLTRPVLSDGVHIGFNIDINGLEMWVVDEWLPLIDLVSLRNEIYNANVGFKNYIINGNFDVWQYGTSQTSNGYASDDRWYNSNGGSTKTHSKVACSDAERALFNASNFSRTSVASVVGTNNKALKTQLIEDVTRLAGKTITISFWAKADTAKNIAIELVQGFGTGGAPSAQVVGIGVQLVALTTTWQKKTITVSIPSAIGKTLGTDGVHTSYTELYFWFEAGSAYNARTASLGQQSGTFDIAQVQIEEGSVATPFENRPYGLELSLCQRYYETSYNNGQYAGQASTTISAVWWMPSSTKILLNIPFKVQKRVTPTVNYYSPQTGAVGNCFNTTGAVDQTITTGGGIVGLNSTAVYKISGATAGHEYSVHFTASSEL